MPQDIFRLTIYTVVLVKYNEYHHHAFTPSVGICRGIFQAILSSLRDFYLDRERRPYFLGGLGERRLNEVVIENVGILGESLINAV